MDRRSACLALVVCLPLVACSRSLAEPATGTPISDLNTLHVKAGLWRHMMVIDGRQGSGDECNAGRPLIPPRPADCSKYDAVRAQGGNIQFESVCRSESVTTTQRSSYTGDLNSAFANDVVVDVEEPGQIANRITGHETYKYLGPCPAEMRPEG
jgi:hypothetical protein